MDPPQHAKLRQIVSRGCTPRVIKGLHDALRERPGRIVAEAARRDGEGDFVTEIAAELPPQAIAELMGVPQADRRRLFDWSDQMPRIARAGAPRRLRSAWLNGVKEFRVRYA